MINPNETTSGEVLQQYKQASYERFRTQFATAVEQKLTDFDMSYDELAVLLNWSREYDYPPIKMNGDDVKHRIRSGELDTELMNDIAHVFSAELYIVLRPRLPWVNT